jgi:hypothetical protein
MKKLLMITGLLCATFGLLFAQSSTPLLYEESTLSSFRDWRFNNAGEEKNFKIPVLFNSAEDITFMFIDSGLEEQIEFESEYPWPPMQSGQRVTIYFNAWGPWVWDRRLDAIDYGNGRLVQVNAEKPSVAESPVQTESRTDNTAQNSGGRTAGAQSPGPGVPVTNPTPAEIDSSNEDPADTGFDYGKQPTAPPRQVIVQISGSPPQRGRYYRLQIGSFSVPGNATRAANSLRELGLEPAFEEFRNNVRVVLSRIPGEDVLETAQKVGSAGFSEIWCREEP